MTVFDMFPNPLFRESYPESDQVEKDIMSLIEGNADAVRNGMTENLLHYENDLGRSLLYREQFSWFKKWIEEQAAIYVRDTLGTILIEDMIITDSWLNVCQKGGYQYPHHHTNSYVSGTYYVNFEDGHAPLIFRNENCSMFSSIQSISLGIDNDKPNKYNSDTIVWPEKGECLFWQSHLTHGYTDNQKDNRISISFNLMPTVVNTDKYSYRVTPYKGDK